MRCEGDQNIAPNADAPWLDERPASPLRARILGRAPKGAGGGGEREPITHDETVPNDEARLVLAGGEESESDSVIYMESKVRV